jgi:hypothetical protein
LFFLSPPGRGESKIPPKAEGEGKLSSEGVKAQAFYASVMVSAAEPLVLSEIEGFTVSIVEPLVLSSTLRLRPEGSGVEGFMPNITNIKIMKTMFRKFSVQR